MSEPNERCETCRYWAPRAGDDAGFRQVRADCAAVARGGPSAAFVHRELSSSEAYETVHFHLLDVLEGRA